MGPFRSEWDETVSPVLDDFARVFAEGPELGVHMAVSVDRTTTLPAPLRGLVRQVLLFRLGDDLDYSQAGFRTTELPEFVPGRAVDGERHLEVQVARPAEGFAVEVAAVGALHPTPERRPVAIGSLPREVPVGDVAESADLDGTPRRLPLGVSEVTLAPVGLTLYPGEHALVAGPARSGKTTTLAVVGAVARAAGWPTAVVAPPRSALGADGDLGPVVRPDDLAGGLSPLLDERGPGGTPLLVLVDDIELVDPDGMVMEGVLGRDDVLVVGAGRADTLRGLYSHWARTLRGSRAGLLLVPDVDLDGDLLAVRLPRRTTTPISAGRGYLCAGGEVELVQVAQP